MRTGDSLHCNGIGRLDKSLLFNDFWRSVASPPATEVWFRCAPPHVASLINGNGVQDRRALLVFTSRKVFVFSVAYGLLRAHPRRASNSCQASNNTSRRA